MRKPYPTDLTDEQWELVAPHIPPARGRRRVDIREVVNAILYLTRAGCQWRMLPHEFPNWRTVHDYHTIWAFNGTWVRMTDALRRRVRREQHPDAADDPATARIDSQSVQSAGQGGEVGIDGGKRVKGRKRSIGVDSLGLLLAVVVTAANGDDARAAGPGGPAGHRAARVRRLEASQLPLVWVHRRVQGEVSVVHREPPAGHHGMGDTTPAVGDRADVRVARPVPPS